MPEKPHHDLEKHKHSAEIVALTAKQITKDFSMFGMDVSFSGNTALAYPELMLQLTAHVQWLLQIDQEKLFALMYQIDISQQSVHECLLRDQNPAAAISDLIIRREMMKVLTVLYFKNLKKNSGQI